MKLDEEDGVDYIRELLKINIARPRRIVKVDPKTRSVVLSKVNGDRKAVPLDVVFRTYPAELAVCLSEKSKGSASGSSSSSASRKSLNTSSVDNGSESQQEATSDK